MQLTKLLEGRSVLHIFFRMKYKNLCCKSWCCSWSHNFKNYFPRASSLEAPGLHDTNLNTLSPQKSNPQGNHGWYCIPTRLYKGMHNTLYFLQNLENATSQLLQLQVVSTALFLKKEVSPFLKFWTCIYTAFISFSRSFRCTQSQISILKFIE